MVRWYLYIETACTSLYWDSLQVCGIPIAKFMGPTWAIWVLSDQDRPHVGPMNLAIRDACKDWDSLTYYSVSLIYRGRVYRGIGYIAVACWTPFFCPPISRILQTWRPRVRYFSQNRGNSLHSIRGRQFFAKSAHHDSLCSCSLEKIFRRNQLEPTCQCGLEHMLCDGQPR